ncbi:hypothetical protein Desor_0491 [Desulfosporosinus orientis DSM 765]|uniref:Uncharacterized protein n=1 Tax=Desulfosporosinus orientis (strain ATCC 19365 / DSM 765 / NCIMB 8382 / VKM B-1628 / Singapore I) TaxID=768706 RepID=G7WA55_DESOD|nr:hypothetical protein [Desulfosporosinus orientis]AET66193.1 hypothetical protein Desor_0491 [Desulfosporosinus orientis DSM 765]
MKKGTKMNEREERRKILEDTRGELLGKLISEREQRSLWLVKLMDIDDELEELSRWERSLELST